MLYYAITTCEYCECSNEFYSDIYTIQTSIKFTIAPLILTNLPQGEPGERCFLTHPKFQTSEIFECYALLRPSEKQQTTDRATKYTQWREASNVLTSFDYNRNDHLLRHVTTNERVEVDPHFYPGLYWL